MRESNPRHPACKAGKALIRTSVTSLVPVSVCENHSSRRLPESFVENYGVFLSFGRVLVPGTETLSPATSSRPPALLIEKPRRYLPSCASSEKSLTVIAICNNVKDMQRNAARPTESVFAQKRQTQTRLIATSFPGDNPHWDVAAA
jgi:hypothetical protein